MVQLNDLVGAQIKGNDLHIGEAPAKYINKVDYLESWHYYKHSIS